MIERIASFNRRAFAHIKRQINSRRVARRAALNVRPNTLGVLAIMKNESSGIDEWISHYLWMGATKIFLIDNGSTDDTLVKAQAWRSQHPVQVVQYTERHRQRQHYWKAIKYFEVRKQCEWLLIADLDEFWFCPNGDTLEKSLHEYGNYDVIYSNWVMFGSSGYVDQPNSVREAFILRRPGIAPHQVKKYICRTSVLNRASSIGIHEIRGADSSRTISDIDRFQLNHYPIQSLDFFRSVKMTRGGVSNVRSDNIRDMSYFRSYDDGCNTVDTKLADLVSSLKFGNGEEA